MTEFEGVTAVIRPGEGAPQGSSSGWLRFLGFTVFYHYHSRRRYGPAESLSLTGVRSPAGGLTLAPECVQLLFISDPRSLRVLICRRRTL